MNQCQTHKSYTGVLVLSLLASSFKNLASATHYSGEVATDRYKSAVRTPGSLPTDRPRKNKTRANRDQARDVRGAVLSLDQGLRSMLAVEEPLPAHQHITLPSAVDHKIVYSPVHDESSVKFDVVYLKFAITQLGARAETPAPFASIRGHAVGTSRGV